MKHLNSLTTGYDIYFVRSCLSQMVPQYIKELDGYVFRDVIGTLPRMNTSALVQSSWRMESTFIMVTHRGLGSLQWRHNGRDSVSNHQPHDCFFNRLFRRRSRKTPKLRVTGLCAGNSPEAGEFPGQMASNAEKVSIWWRHHGHNPKANHNQTMRIYCMICVWTMGKIFHLSWKLPASLLIHLPRKYISCLPFPYFFAIAMAQVFELSYRGRQRPVQSTVYIIWFNTWRRKKPEYRELGCWTDNVGIIWLQQYNDK